MSDLPSPTALRMFVRAASTLSFAAAAASLNVTQAAVSKQIANLEDRVGAKLFLRGHKSIELSPSGRAYLPIARHVLSLLEAGLEQSTALAGHRSVVIEADYEFLEFVLMPRLGQLSNQIPGLEIKFVPSFPGRHRIKSDLAITYGHPGPDATDVERLASFDVFAVGRPDLVNSVEDPLAELPLFHDLNTQWWRTVLGEEGVTRLDQGVVMGYGALAIHAAMAGKGLAVGDSLLCHDALRSGDIVRVGTHTFPGREDYWISRHPDATSNEMASRVMEWVRSEVRRMEN